MGKYTGIFILCLLRILGKLAVARAVWLITSRNPLLIIPEPDDSFNLM